MMTMDQFFKEACAVAGGGHVNVQVQIKQSYAGDATRVEFSVYTPKTGWVGLFEQLRNPEAAIALLRNATESPHATVDDLGPFPGEVAHVA